jgi:hypothetical protein
VESTVTTAREHYLLGAMCGAALSFGRSIGPSRARGTRPLRRKHPAGSVLLFLA